MLRFFNNIQQQFNYWYNEITGTQNESYAHAYFRAKINGENNIDVLYDLAVADIFTRYPKAQYGNLYWMSVSSDISHIDFYFLRRLTYRNCHPPYRDKEIHIYEEAAIKEMKKIMADEQKAKLNEADAYHQEYRIC